MGEIPTPQPAATPVESRQPVVTTTKTEAPRRTQTPEQKARRTRNKVEKQVNKRIAEEQRAIDELRAKGIDLSKFNGKTPADVLDEINRGGAGWQNDEATRAYIQGGMELNREIQIARDQIRVEKNEKNEPIDEDAILVEAQKRVQEKRVADALPKVQEGEAPVEGEDKGESEAAVAGAEVVDAPKTPAETAADETKAATEAERLRVQKITEEYAKNGENPALAREALTLIASEQGADAAKQKVEDIRTRIANAPDKKTQESLHTELERALKIQQEAERMLAAERKKFEKKMTDPKTPVETRLFAYDMELRYARMEATSIDKHIFDLDITIDTGTPEERVIALAKKTKLEEQKKSLTDKIDTLSKERGQIGTPEQRDVDYITAEVMMLTRDVSPLSHTTKGEDGAEVIVNETPDERQKAIAEDPIAYLQKVIDTSKDGMQEILEHSGIDTRTQKQLLAISTGLQAARAVRGKELEGKAVDVGKGGLFAILLLLYTAYGTNKKAKGQAMG